MSGGGGGGGAAPPTDPRLGRQQQQQQMYNYPPAPGYAGYPPVPPPVAGVPPPGYPGHYPPASGYQPPAEPGREQGIVSSSRKQKLNNVFENVLFILMGKIIIPNFAITCFP